MSAAAASTLDPCSHRPPCPGCPRYGEGGLAAAVWTRLGSLASDTGAVLHEPAEGEPLGHRHRARLMVRGRAASPKVGLFQEGTHRIVDIPRCGVHHPVVNVAASALKRAMREHGVAPYAEAPHRGIVRALQVVVERSSQTAQLGLILNASESHELQGAAQSLFTSLAEEMGTALHSLWWNANPERTNSIVGRRWERLQGPQAVEEEIGGARVFFPPGAFGQSHLALADRIVAELHAQVEPGSRVVELYAGCGAIGLGLARRGHVVLFNEVSPHGLSGLELGLAALAELDPDSAARVEIAPGPAAGCAAAAGACDVTIVDPPRRGLEPELCQALAVRPPLRLLYLSCDLSSLERDARALVASGRLELRSLRPYVLFPFTDHVETLAVFERVR